MIVISFSEFHAKYSKVNCFNRIITGSEKHSRGSEEIKKNSFLEANLEDNKTIGTVASLCVQGRITFLQRLARVALIFQHT